MGLAKKKLEKKNKYTIGYLDDDYNEKSKIYEHTNEKMGSLVNGIKKPESILTVGSSGDHLFNFLAEGVYKIDTFDINTITNYYINLRLAGLTEIKNIHELYSFLFRINKNGYDKCKDALDHGSYLFWEHLFEKFSIEDLQEKLFRPDIDDSEILDNNAYFNIDSLKELKRNIKHLERYNYSTHLFNIHSFIQDKKYDAIILSNIYDYVDTKQFLRYLRILRNYLTKEGRIYYSYQYDGLESYSTTDFLMRKDIWKFPIEREDLEDEFQDIIQDTDKLMLSTRKKLNHDTVHDYYLSIGK
jgi:hypothetical protein